jgi:hypothetical protein
MVKAPGRNLYKRSHRTVDSVPESEPPRLEVVQTLPDERRIAWQHRRGFADYAISFAKSMDAIPAFRHHTGKLVTQDHGVIDRPTVPSMVLVKIASANPNGIHSEQDIFLAYLRDGNLTKFNRTGLLGEIDQSNH